jgi:O-ureido-D-serine cyclo-ligase
MQLRVATCLALPEPDPDHAPLAEGLKRAGIDAAWLGWDDPSVDWDAPVPTLLRTTWNYADDLPAFLGWIDRVAKAGPLLNPAEVVKANVHKRYLLDLQARGVPIVPTVVVARGAVLEPASLVRLGGGDLIVKPEVGAGSRGVMRFAGGDVAGTAAHVAVLAGESAVLIQPYLASVEGHGERSLIWIDGELTHAIRKARRLAGDAESITGPFTIADDERAVAMAAMAAYADRVLYGRVDVARDAEGKPRVMELELIEPSLFFATSPAALERYLAGLRRRLR